MKTMLFIDRQHAPNDPRLHYREMKTLAAANKDIKFVFLRIHWQYEAREITVHESALAIDDITMEHIEIRAPRYQIKWQNIWRWLRGKKKLKKAIVKLAAKMPIGVIQASDVREIPFALAVAKDRPVLRIYDSHEDYVRQVLDYQGISMWSLFQATRIYLRELFCVRCFDAVFCTDDFLVDKYKRWWYGQKNVFGLRNYPRCLPRRECGRKDDDLANCLRLVYIGSINHQRGVIECAEFTGRFNARHKDKSLHFTVIGQHHPLLDKYIGMPWFTHEPRIDYAELMPKLIHYDVGICLWQNIVKYHRNLPLKNFDYMAAGLPILTSNFGLLKKYLDIMALS